MSFSSIEVIAFSDKVLQQLLRNLCTFLAHPVCVHSLCMMFNMLFRCIFSVQYFEVIDAVTACLCILVVVWEVVCCMEVRPGP